MTTATANATAPYPAPDIDAAVARGLDAARDRPNPVVRRRLLRPKIRRHGPGFSRQTPGSIWTKATCLRHPTRPGAWWRKRSRPSAPTTDASSTPTAPSGMVVGELAQLVGDAGDMETQRWIANSFVVARNLHSNFYENRSL